MMKIIYLVNASLILSILSIVSANQPSSSCVDNDVGLSFKEAEVQYNNLGGVGPDSDDSDNLLAISNVGQFNGIQLYLFASIVDVDGEDYALSKNGSNGLKGEDFLRINMRRSRKATVRFEITNSERTPVVLPGFVVSVFDVDEGVTEHYVMKNWTTAQYETTPPAEATFTESSGLCQDVEENCLYAHSFSKGHGCDNPTDPFDLGIVNCKDDNEVNQRKRAFQVTFEDTSFFELYMWFEANGDGNNSGRNVLISFNSQLSDMCDDEFTCV